VSTNLEKLEIYKIAMELETDVHRFIKLFPLEEKYRKTDQLKRSSSSVADNIAESHGRYGFRDKAQFLYLARGSAEEASSQLERANHLLELHQDQQIGELVSEYDILAKKINGYIRYLKTQNKTV